MTKTQFLVRTSLFLAITLAIQFLRLPQYLTGPLVNFMFILSTLLVTYWSGIFIGAVTPYIAFAVGILPAPLAPMIPFIMLGNMLYVLSFFWLRGIHEVLAIILASVVKFSLLALAVRLIIDVPPPVAQAMQFPQLITALGGGILAILLAKTIKQRIYSR